MTSAAAIVLALVLLDVGALIGWTAAHALYRQQCRELRRKLREERLVASVRWVEVHALHHHLTAVLSLTGDEPGDVQDRVLSEAENAVQAATEEHA